MKTRFKVHSFNKHVLNVPGTARENPDWNRPPWPTTIVTICVSYFMTGGPDKEHGTNKSPPTGRIRERSERHAMYPTGLPESSLLASILAKQWTHHQKDLESEWLAKNNPETNPITIKPNTAKHVAELFSWVPLPCCSPPGCPFPIKSLALSARVSLDNLFPSVRQEPSFAPWKGSPFLQRSYFLLL